ncbi:MAG TPA: helix-turn-helix domain-containing protein [Brevibacterium sp.]|nr:helix-turn-helix domain-containing protein [Brevibacterium sp.]
MDDMNKDWLTTGETAVMLGVSRQHVVDLCDRGELPFSRAGSHRRIRRSDVQQLLEPPLTREQEKSLWLHRALLGPLMIDPTAVLDHARKNITAWLPQHRADGMVVRYLEQWLQILDGGVDDVAEVLVGSDERSSELRQNSPFAGVLSDEDRRRILASFREHWDQEHPAA